jgi:hypothetical protein
MARGLSLKLKGRDLLQFSFFKLKGNFYKMCVQSKMVYGSETWPVTVENEQRLERTERIIVR